MTVCGPEQTASLTGGSGRKVEPRQAQASVRSPRLPPSSAGSLLRAFALICRKHQGC